MQEKMKERRRSRAFNAPYESTRQLVLSGFETLFERELDKRNRWVVLSQLIPWDEICGIYLAAFDNPATLPMKIITSENAV